MIMRWGMCSCALHAHKRSFGKPQSQHIACMLMHWYVSRHGKCSMQVATAGRQYGSSNTANTWQVQQVQVHCLQTKHTVNAGPPPQ